MLNNELGFEPIEDDKFSKAADFTFRDDIEGGYTVDHAGATKFGITQDTLDAFNKKHGYPNLKVKDITLDDAKYVAKKQYFDEPNYNKLPNDVSAVMFDYGFNASPLKATKTLQSIVGAKPDGQLGDKTIAAVNDYVGKYGEKTLAKNIVDKRADHYKSLVSSNPEKYKKYENGWMNRINKIKDSFDLSSLIGISTAHADELPADYGDIGFKEDTSVEDVKKNDFQDLGFQEDSQDQNNDFGDLGFEAETIQGSVEKKAKEFSDLSLRDMSHDEISQARPKNVIDHIKDFFRQSPEESVAKAQNIYAISKNTGIPPLEVEKNYNELSRNSSITGIKAEINREEYLTSIMAPMLAAGALTNPVGTAAGVAAFMGLDKLIPTREFIPSDASDTTKAAIELADFIAKGAIVGGVFKAAPRVVEGFTKQKVESYNLPKDIFLTPEQVKDIFQTGKLTTPEQVSAFGALNLTREQLKTAIKEGVSFPIEKIVTMADKPWYAKFKEILGIKPSEKVLSSEKINRPAIRGLLESPEQQLKAQSNNPPTPEAPKFPEAEKAGKVIGIDAETKLPIIDTRQAVSQTASSAVQPSEKVAKPLEQSVVEQSQQGAVNEKSQGQETSKEVLVQDSSTKKTPSGRVSEKKSISKPVTLLGEIRKRGGIDLEKAKAAGYTYDDFKQFGLLSVLKKGGQSPDDLAGQFVSENILQNTNDSNPTDLLMQTLKYNKDIIQKKSESLEMDYDKEYEKWLEQNQKEPAYAEIQESDIARIEADIEKEISSQEAQGLDWTDNAEPAAVINKTNPADEVKPESKITPSGQVRPELLPPEKKSLFQEEGEMFRKNSGIDASGGNPTIDQYEPSGNSKDKQEAFKLSERVVGLVKKYAERFGENYNPSGTAGAFFRSSNNIFVNAKNDVGVAAHEVTHYLDKKIGFTSSVMALKGYAKNGNPIYEPSTKSIRKELTDIYTKYYPGGKKDHPLNTRIKEGIAVFTQRMVTNPIQTAKEFPELKKDFLTPQGRYHDPLIPEFISEARTIVDAYQKLNDLDKIKSRVVDAEVMKDSPFLNIQETAIYKNIDNKYPLEKLAKEAGEHFKKNDPSLIARIYDHVPMLIQHNLSDSAFVGLGPWGFGKETYLSMKGNGEVYQKYDFNWHTLVNKVGGELEDFNGWLVARRVVENYKNVEKTKQIFKDKANELKAAKDAGVELEAEGMKELIKETLDAKRAYQEAVLIVKNDRFDKDVAIRAYEQNKERFKDSVKMFDNLVKADAELVHEAGMISDKRYQDLLSEEGYASFKRQIENEIIGTGENSGSNIVRVGKNKVSSLFRYGGSGKDIISPVYSSMENHQEIMKKASRQLVYNSVGNIADKFPELFQKIPLKSFKEEDGKIIYPQDKDPNIMMAYSKGMRVPYLVNKDLKSMMDAMLTPANVGLTEKIFVGLAQAFTKGTTAFYIPFAATNFVIDQLSAASNSWTKFKPIYTPISEFVKVLSNRDSIDAKYAMEYFMLGGERQAYLSFADLNPKEAYEFMRSEKGAIEKTIEILNAGGDILATPVKTTELLTRMSEFIRARKEGYSQLAALELAGRISTPFHHRGQKGDVYRFLTRSIPYLNASIQVLAQEARSLKNPKSRYRALFIVAAISTAAIAGIATVLRSTEEQKDLLKGLSVDRLNRFVYLPNPDGQTLIKIRVPQEKMAFASIFNMAMIDAQLNAKYSAFEYLRGATGWIPDQLNPTDMGRMIASWIPQAASPSLQVAFNVKLYPQIRALEPDYMKALPKDERVFENSSSMSKWLAPKMGLSPIQFDSLIEGYTGRSLRYVSGREIGNPFQESMYLTSSRQLIGFYAERDKNDIDYNRMKDDPKSFSVDERFDINRKHDRINKIEKLLKNYRKVTKENKNAPSIRDLRTDILDSIDSL